MESIKLKRKYSMSIYVRAARYEKNLTLLYLVFLRYTVSIYRIPAND